MTESAKELSARIARVMDDKKAENIEILNVSELTGIAECFVICDGTSGTQVKAIAAAVEEELTKVGVEPRHIEGNRGDNWILMDYDNVVVHIFYKETRRFYDLERLWNEAEKIEFLQNNTPNGSDK